MRSVLFLVVVALLSACPPESSLEPLDIEEGCQPLTGDCFLPFPSDFYLVDDSALPSGKRVEIPDVAKPITEQGQFGSVLDYAPTDGASRTPPIIALLGAVDGRELTGVRGDPFDAAELASETLIVEASTGRFIPHYVDVDARHEDPDRQAIVLRPVERLAEQSRYVVALKGLKTPDGESVTPPEGFRRLRDAQSAQDPALAALQDRYDRDVFSVLVDAGVDRENLTLAWDFSTGSDANVNGDMLDVREQALTWLSTNTPAFTIENVLEDRPDRFRTIFGTVTGPLFTDIDAAGAKLNRGDDGRVQQNGEASFRFTAVVPLSVERAEGPGELVFYGHGFFGSRDEVEGGAAAALLDGASAVGVAIDWKGMSTPDVGTVVSTLGGDVQQAPLFAERVPQAMVNWLVLAAAMKGALGQDPAFRRDDDTSLITTERIGFIGISQGHILGGTLCALHPDLDRCVLQVGGAGLSHMMFRALPFDSFLGIMQFSLPDKLDQQKFAAMAQIYFDAIDPSFWANHVQRDELPSGPSSNPSNRAVLMQMGIGDTSVPNSGTIFHARLLGLPQLSPTPLSVPGLDEVDGAQSALTIFDFGVDPSFTDVPIAPDDATYTHDGLRRHSEVHDQIRAFFEQGTVIHPCPLDGCILQQL